MNNDNVFGLRIIECGNGFRVEYSNDKCRDILKELVFSMVESIRSRVCRECKGTGFQEEDACPFCWGHGYVEAAQASSPQQHAPHPPSVRESAGEGE